MRQRATPSGPWALVALCLVTSLAGCAQGTVDFEQSSAQRASSGAQAPSIEGRVFDESGGPIAEAVVDDRTEFTQTQTDKEGFFRLTPRMLGVHKIVVLKEGFQEAGRDVTIGAQQTATVAIVLLAVGDGTPDRRSHRHDYWAGASEVEVINRTFEWHGPDGRARPYGSHAEVSSYYSLASQPVSSSCIYKGRPFFNNRPVWFDEESQLVWPGTARIHVRAAWRTQDAPTVGEMYVAWRPANSHTFHTEGPIRNDQWFAIEIDAEMADNPHQPFTHWEFHLCVSASERSETGAWVVGDVDVAMRLERGYAVGFDPPHPDAWGNATELVLLDHDRRSVSGPYQIDRYAAPSLLLLLPEGKTVAPLTHHLRIELSWRYEPDLPLVAHGLSYRPANSNPSRPYDDSTLMVPQVVESAPGRRVLEARLADGQADGIYQTRSAWAFHLGLEGQERDSTWINPCGACTIHFTTTIVAVRGE